MRVRWKLWLANQSSHDMNGGQDLGHSGLVHSEHMTRSAALDMKPHFPGSILGSLL